MSHSDHIPAEVEREMTPAVRAFFETQRRAWQKRVDELEARVAQLERELKKHDRFRRPDPPSATVVESVEPGSPPDIPQPTSKKKRGGQPGHPKSERPFIPSDECDEVITLLPTECRGCGGTLTGCDADPWRHQVWELPEIKPLVTEYQRHRLVCTGCGKSTCAELPEGVPTGQSGPRLVAFVALLMVCFRLSKRRVSLFCEMVLNVPLCPGTIIKLQSIATAATRPAYDTLVKKLRKQDHLNGDETPTKQGNQNAWIWTLVAATFTVFAVRLTKAACVIHEILTLDYAGVLTSDRAKMYLWCPRLQWCWAHLKRDFEAMSLRAGEAGEIGKRLAELTDEMFHHWHRVRDGTVTWETFIKHRDRLYGQVHLALEDGTRCADNATAATCAGLLERYDNLWRFAETQPGLDPTNNAAERALRHPVIWKQLSFGTQSDPGSRFVETLLTVLETCRQREKNTFDFLTQAITAHFAGQKPPSLLARV